jgi:glycosyltransferase involved in cell wall biosynthesis
VNDKAHCVGPHTLSIGLVSETYAPEVNGVAMTLDRLVNGLGNEGHYVEVYRPAQHRNEKAVSCDTIRHIPMPGMPIPGYREMHFGFPAGRFFRSHWKQHRPDVVYVATEGPLGASAIKAARKRGIPVISGFHTNFHSYCSHYYLGWLAPAILAYLRRLHNQTAMTLAPTNALARELADKGFNNVEVMQRGVDIELFSPSRRDKRLREKWGADDDSIVCIYVGRIAPEKNIRTAIDTVLALIPHHNIRFVLVGDGPMRQRLEREHPGFFFCGTRHGEELAAHYASADILLFPSRTETFGNVVTEGMASGLATVAFDEAAAHEHITDFHNGVLANDNPTQSFTAVTARLCAQRELIGTIGNNAREYTQQLNWPTIVSRFKALLHSASAGSEPVRHETRHNPGVQP